MTFAHFKKIIIYMLDNINSILIDLFVAIIIYILAVFIGVFVKRNNGFMIPILFGLMFGLYISLRSL
jgi:uncharacterized membrane protein